MILAHLPRVRRLRRRALAASMIGVPLLTSGCGPSVPVQLGMKNVPLDIAVGNDVPTRPPVAHGPTAPPVAQALPVIVPVAAAPAPAVQGFTPPAPVVVGSGEVCPQLDKTKASPAAATPEVDDAATAGKWPNRSGGTLNINGAVIPVPTQGTWTVGAANQSAQGVSDFTEQGMAFGFPGAAAGYHASNSTSAPSTPLATPTSSFGLSQLVVFFANGAWVYRPVNPLKLLATPAAANSAYQPDPNNPAIPNTTGTWTDTETDPANGNALTIQATDEGLTRVNACGTPVDAWKVHAVMTLTGTTVTTGAVPTPAKTDLTLDVTYAVATGLGGMIVDETVKTLPNPDGSVSYFAGAIFSDDTTATLSAPKPEAS
jgi:hypothetical protein